MSSEAPDLAIHKKIMRAVDLYSGTSGNHQPRYSAYPFPQRLALLSQNLRMHVLRELGDIKGYLAMQQEIFTMAPQQRHRFDDLLYGIVSWLDQQMDAMFPIAEPTNSMVISLLAFGDEYVQKMLDFNFASLMAWGNLPTLVTEKDVVIYIHTSAKGREIIEAAAITAEIKAIGVTFLYAIIPDAISVELTGPNITYWLLGASATLGLHFAKMRRAVFHHSFPDIIYSERFFSELLRLSRAGHRAIIGSGMRADQSLLIPHLEAYRTPFNLAISSADLMAHHLNCLHICAWPMVVNNRPPSPWLYPRTHIMIWEAEEMVHVNSPHLNAWWLDSSLIEALPARFYWTMDSELDFFCHGEDYYVIQEGDEIYQAELSDSDRSYMNDDAYCPAFGAANNLWNCITHRDTAKFFFRDMRVRLNRTIRPYHTGIIPQVEVMAGQRFLYNSILTADPNVTSETTRPRTHAAYMF